MKRLISIALMVLTLFMLIPVSVSAEDELTFQLSDDGTYYIVSQCDIDAKDVVIPSTYDGKPVLEIGMAFMSCQQLETVVIPEGITAISDYAFSYCDSLLSVSFPKSLLSIGDSAFWGCDGLTNVVIANSVEFIGANAFRSCENLKYIYCEAKSTPENWDRAWNKFCDAEVVWDSNKIAITQNLASVSVKNGEVAKVTVNASGVGLTYKWFYKNKGANNFLQTNSYKGKTYSVSMDSTRSGRQVYCIITNAFGKSVKTNVATLGMEVELKDDLKSISVQSGNTAKVTVNALGDGLKYKWYFKDKGALKFSLTSSFNGNSYYVPMNATRAGRQVYCVITDKYGNSVKSNTVTLGMAVKIVTQPTSVSVANGTTAKVTVKASGEGLKYQWYFKEKTSAKFLPTSSFMGSSYYVQMTNVRAGRQVYCVITDKYGNTQTTNVVTLNKK